MRGASRGPARPSHVAILCPARTTATRCGFLPNSHGLHAPEGSAATDTLARAPAGRRRASDSRKARSIVEHPDIESGDVTPHDELMRLALTEARAALTHDDVPVGAIVLRDGVVIAARHNERELTGDPTAHAEVLVLRDAAAAIGNWRLDECTLVVTLEPCAMCAGAMVNSRLGHLVYGASDPKAGAAGSCFDLIDSPMLNHRIPRTTGILADECGQLLVDFFRARRQS